MLLQPGLLGEELCLAVDAGLVQPFSDSLPRDHKGHSSMWTKSMEPLMAEVTKAAERAQRIRRRRQQGLQLMEVGVTEGGREGGRAAGRGVDNIRITPGSHQIFDLLPCMQGWQHAGWPGIDLVASRRSVRVMMTGTEVVLPAWPAG